MSEDLNWNFNLMDGIRGPAAEMSNALLGLTKNLNVAAEALGKFEKDMKETKGGSEQASRGLAEFGLQLSAIKQIAAPVFEAGKWALEMGWDFERKGIEALAFKENTLASFEVLLGSAKEAQEFFSQAAWLGKATPFQTKDVVEQFQRLLSAGFTKQEVPVVFQMVGDAAALRGFDPQVMNHLTNALAHIMSASQSQMGGALRMFAMDAAGTGFQRGKFNSVLARNLGVDPASVEDLLHSGQITARQVVKAIMDQMAEAGNGMTGGIMKAQENTLSGILSTLESTFQDFFLTLEGKADDVKGFGVLKGALMNLREALDTTKPAGKELQRVVVDAFSSITTTLFGSLNGPDGLKSLERIVRQTAVVFEDLADAVKIGLGGAEAMVVSFLKGVGLMNSSADELFSGPMSAEELAKHEAAFKEFGASVGEALAGVVQVLRTLKSVWDDVKPFFGWVAEHPALLKGLVDAMPGGGLITGAMANIQQRTEERAVRESVETASGPPGAAGSAFYGPPAPPNITVHVNGDHLDPDAVGRAAAAGAKSALAKQSALMRRTAYQTGDQ